MLNHNHERHLKFLGKDISEERDESILRRVIKRGEGHEPVNEDSVVEVNLKGTHQGQVFDERTVTFIAGAGCVENIPLG
jgi:FKBP-type peptidyl-prolyl cis-trans isomerase